MLAKDSLCYREGKPNSWVPSNFSEADMLISKLKDDFPKVVDWRSVRCNCQTIHRSTETTELVGDQLFSTLGVMAHMSARSGDLYRQKTLSFTHSTHIVLTPLSRMKNKNGKNELEWESEEVGD